MLYDVWVEVGTVAAIIAIKARGDSRKSVQYERIREARELLASIRHAAENTRFSEANTLNRQLAAVTLSLDGDYPALRAMTDTTWDLATWPAGDIGGKYDRAIVELEDALKRLN